MQRVLEASAGGWAVMPEHSCIRLVRRIEIYTPDVVTADEEARNTLARETVEGRKPREIEVGDEFQRLAVRPARPFLAFCEPDLSAEANRGGRRVRLGIGSKQERRPRLTAIPADDLVGLVVADRLARRGLRRIFPSCHLGLGVIHCSPQLIPQIGEEVT